MMKRVTNGSSSQGLQSYCNGAVQKCLLCLKCFLLPCRHYCTRRVVTVMSMLILLLAICCSYYLYLDRLYLFDEVLEGDMLRELTIREKLTIRVLVPNSGVEDLSQFVLYHAICPSVHEIQVLWHLEEAPPPDSYFKYSKTHSKVSFYRFSDKHLIDNMYGHTQVVETESLLLLDADVFVSCEDLSLSLSSWRSSNDALLGFFPRIHKYHGGDDGGSSSSSSSSRSISLEGWRQVVWDSTYSILLSSGLFLNPSQLQAMVESTALRDFITAHPHCLDLAVPLWITASNNGVIRRTESEVVDVTPPSPVWVVAPSLSIRTSIILSDHPIWLSSSSSDSIIITGEGVRVNAGQQHHRHYNNSSVSPSNHHHHHSSSSSSSSSSNEATSNDTLPPFKADNNESRALSTTTTTQTSSSSSSPSPSSPSPSSPNMRPHHSHRYLISPKSKLSPQRTNTCLTDLTHLLNITHYPTSTYKATRASTHIFW